MKSNSNSYILFKTGHTKLSLPLCTSFSNVFCPSRRSGKNSPAARPPKVLFNFFLICFMFFKNLNYSLFLHREYNIVNIFNWFVKDIIIMNTNYIDENVLVCNNHDISRRRNLCYDILACKSYTLLYIFLVYNKQLLPLIRVISLFFSLLYTKIFMFYF